MEPADLNINGNKLRMTLPIQKVDKAKRIVSGFATIDTLDRQGDIVLTDASKRAFSRWRGNIREMHEPVAVGKAVSFREEPFIDPDTNELHTGIFVDAYISTGAENTWQKVLDGTLTGFSIGGGIIDAEHKLQKDGKSKVRIIKDYELTELSLVDNPAHQHANIMSIQKVADGAEVTGLATVDLLNVYVNNDTQEFLLTKSDDLADGSYEYLGWIEDNDRKVEQIRKLYGGETMAENTKAAEVSEVESTTEAQPSLESLFTKFAESLTASIEAANTAHAETLEKATGSVTEVVTKVEALAAQQEELAKGQTTLTETLATLDARLGVVENSGAVKKSEEVQEPQAPAVEEDNHYVSKVFKGSFLPFATVIRKEV